MTGMPRKAALISLCLVFVSSSWAWGPDTDTAVVATATHVISREGTTPLSNLERDVRAGADITTEELASCFPGLSAGYVPAIQAEIILLQAVRGQRVDPYYAYRLGRLGKLVASTSAPMRDAEPMYREAYYRDVDANLKQTELKPLARTPVDAAYFSVLAREAKAREEIIKKDYQDGLGFRGSAAAGLSEDISRSIKAVADVWLTVLRGSVVAVNVDKSRIQEYLLDALQFYVKRGNAKEVEIAHQRLLEEVGSSPDILKMSGDMFFEAGDFTRAIQEYEAVLAAEPGRKDVVARIVAYYVKVGDKAFQSGDLEGARDAYVLARDANKLDEELQAKVIEAETAIADRDQRLEEARKNIEEAEKLENRATQEAARRNFAEAMEMLQQADELYISVPDEFMRERQAAESGRRRVSSMTRDLKNNLAASVTTLSGSGVSLDVREIAEEQARPLGEEILRTVVEGAYREEMRRLQLHYEDLLETPGAL